MENLDITKVVRVGSSFGVIIPRKVLIGINWQRGDTIMFSNYQTGQVTLRALTDVEIKYIKNKVGKI